VPVPAPPVLPSTLTAPVAVPPAPIPVPAPPVLPASATDPSVTMRAPVAPPPVEHKPDSVELLRKRTGTPRVGVPVVPGAMPPDQAPVAGVIDPSDARPLDALAPHESAPHARRGSEAGDAQSAAKRRLLQSDPNFSQAWFDEGDDLHGGAGGEDEPLAKLKRARKASVSPGTTDIGYYDDLPQPRRRWGLFAGIGAFVVIGGVVAFAMTRGGTPPAAQVAAVVPQPAAAPIDAAPSTILPSDPAAPTATAPTPAAPTATAPVATTPPAPTPAAPPPTAIAATPPPAPPPPSGMTAPAHAANHVPAPARTASRAPADTSGGFPVLGAPEPARRPGGSAPPIVSTLPPAGPTIVDATPKTSGPQAPSLTNNPSDPYGSAPAEAPASGDGGSPDKKAEFFANLGSQQLNAGDTAGAASNFKKALELDGKSIAAMTGMGEIAVRQGLFGDAIAHLTKATRMAPKNSRALTLLGEAYLASGNSAQAASNFKKALQIDPDNARARDGYNEASSRVPPPSDDQ
jgi:hypothetical protein